MILCNKKGEPIGEFNNDIDMEVGDSTASNDFETYTNDVDFNYSLILPGTEYGGFFNSVESQTLEAEKKWNGITFRGLLTKAIIIPPKGSDYKRVSGEANTVLKELLKDVLGGIFKVPETDTKIIINNYQFKLYCTVLDGIRDMLKQYGLKLKIYTQFGGTGRPFDLFAEAVPIVKINDELTSNLGVNLRISDFRNGINHLVCMGKGELQNRQRVDLYLNNDGSVVKQPFYTGFYERVSYYDYPNAESLEDLEKSGKEKLLELGNYKKLELEVTDNADLEIGDIAIGRDYETNSYIEKPIVRKIIKITAGQKTTEYKVEGEN